MQRDKSKIERRSFHFSKMQGLGNDFVIVNALSGCNVPSADRIARLSDRHYGIGFDQFLVLKPGNSPTTFSYQIYNADGSEAQQCGNGMRCLARYVFTRGLTPSKELRFDDGRRQIQAYLEDDGEISVNMGRPIFSPEHIPFQSAFKAKSYELMVNGLKLEVGVLSMGNPHAVLRVNQIRNAAVAEIGRAMEVHEAFPERTNVGFFEIRTPREIWLRVWERGTGETLACGSGACAAVVWGHLMGWLEPAVSVDLPGGKLQVRWSGDDGAVWLRGPAVEVYEGDLSEL